ncbi:MAG: hypothetical protein J7J01_08205 [Methanophagales archaeon]|nr:hypothetical protein [Methanophagales archaeon]
MRGKAVVFVSSKRYLKCVRTPHGWKIYYGGDPAFVKFIRRLTKEEKIRLCKRLSALIQKSAHKEVEKVKREIEREIKRLKALLEV